MNRLTQKVTFDEDEALSLAERTFSTEIDEQLASDIIQYASRLHSRYLVNQQSSTKCPGAGCTDQGCPAHYAAPQPTPEVAKLVETLSTIRAMFPTKIDKQAFVVNGGPPLRVDDDDEFYSVKKVNALVNAIVSTVDEALAAYRKQGGGS